MAASDLHTVSVDLTADQLLHLNNVADGYAPIEIFRAPGPSGVIIPVSFLAELVHGGTVPSWGYTLGLVLGGTGGGDNGEPISCPHPIEFAGSYAAGSRQLGVSTGSDTPSLFESVDVIVNQALKIAVTSGYSDVGTIKTSSLNSGGSGYAAGDTGHIITNGQTYHVDTVDGGGAVVTYHLTGSSPSGYINGAFGYTTATSGGQPGSGTGFAIDVTSTHPSDSTLRISASFYIADPN